MTGPCPVLARGLLLGMPLLSRSYREAAFVSEPRPRFGAVPWLSGSTSAVRLIGSPSQRTLQMCYIIYKQIYNI